MTPLPPLYAAQHLHRTVCDPDQVSVQCSAPGIPRNTHRHSRIAHPHGARPPNGGCVMGPRLPFGNASRDQWGDVCRGWGQGCRGCRCTWGWGLSLSL